MISTTERGTRLGGLVRYLFGPGRHEEHSNQRVVACSDPTWIGTNQPDPQTLAQLIAELDDTHARFGDRTSKGHVWHLIVAVPATDGDLSDSQWRRTADLFAERLGLADGHVAWAAVNHGRSAQGNDHIHIVVNLIRDDRTLVNLWRDAYTRRDVARQLETEFGLTATTAAGAGNGEAVSRYEAETLREHDGAIVLPRHQLAALLRVAAVTAQSEREFIRTLRSHGVILRPRVDKIDPTRVTGYSVALPGKLTGGKLIWFGGGTLDRDLRLPALRSRWPDPTEATATQWRSTRPSAAPHIRPAEITAARRALDDIAATVGWFPILDAAERRHLAEDSARLLAAAAATTSDPFLQRALLSACRALDQAVAELPSTVSPPLGLTSSLQTVHICRAVLAASRPSTTAGAERVDALVRQVTQVSAQITDLVVAQAHTRAAMDAADAARRALDLATAVTRPGGWLRPSAATIVLNTAPDLVTAQAPAPGVCAESSPPVEPGP